MNPVNAGRIDSFQSQHTLEQLAKQILGARCVILKTNPFESEERPEQLEPTFKMGVADDLLMAYRSRGNDWNVQDMRLAVSSRAHVWKMQTAFRQRGLSFDPATVRAEAWGESLFLHGKNFTWSDREERNMKTNLLLLGNVSVVIWSIA